MSVSKITSSYNIVRTYSSPTNKSASQSRINTTSKSVSSSQKASSSMQKTSSYVKSNNTADKNATSVSTNNSSAGGRSSSAINTSRSTAVIKPSSVTSKQNVVGKTTPSVQKSSVVSTARSSLSTKSNAAIKQNSTTTKSQTSISGKASTVPTYSAKSNPSGKTVTTSKNATSASSAKASKATVTKAATAIKTTSNKNVSTNVSVSSSARASLSKTSSAVKTVTSTNVNSKKTPQKASAVVRTESEKAVAKSTASVNKSKISGSNNSTKATSALSKKIATKVNTSNVNTASTAKKKSSKPTESDIKNAPAALAAKNVGIEINSKGEPIGNKEEIKKFNKEMERLREKTANIMIAKAAGIAVDPSGNPRINGKDDFERFESARKELAEKGITNKLNNIDSSVYYCQTGGWWKDIGDTGVSNCSKTAIATSYTINTWKRAYPNDVIIKGDSIEINGKSIPRNNFTGVNYEEYLDDSHTKGVNYYTFTSEDYLISAINNELNEDRSVVVKTDFGSLNMHWVTITGTANGEDADRFDDYVGIDPWFNGNGEGGLYNNSEAFSGVFNLSTTGQNLHSDNAMFVVVR